MHSNYPSKLLENAVEAIGTLPGIGSRSALRLAMHLLRQPAENVHHFTEAINSLRDNVKYCRECNMISDWDTCAICSDRTRDRSTICVVQSVRDVMSIEATGQYHGLYHVLGGVVSPINGIGPSDLTIAELVSRVKAFGESPVEVILALSSTMEGDTTNFYISRKLAPLGVKVSVIARGISVGNELEYTDEVTLGRSIVNRTPFNT